MVVLIVKDKKVLKTGVINLLNISNNAWFGSAVNDYFVSIIKTRGENLILRLYLYRITILSREKMLRYASWLVYSTESTYLKLRKYVNIL